MTAKTLVRNLTCALTLLTLTPALASAQERQCPDQQRAERLDVEASASFDAGRLQQAAELWRQTYEACNNPTSLWNIARSHEELRELTHARAFFDLHQAFPGLPGERLAAGQQKLDEIERSLERFEDRVALGDQRREARDHSGAAAAYRQAWAIHRTPELMFALSEALRQQGRLGEAIKLLEEHRLLTSLGDADRERSLATLRELRALRETRLEAQVLAVSDEAPGAGVGEGVDGFKAAGWTVGGIGGAMLLTGGLLALQDNGNNNGNNNNGGRRGPRTTGDNGQGALSSGLLIAGGVAMGVSAALLTIGYTLDDDEPEAEPATHLVLGAGTIGVGGTF